MNISRHRLRLLAVAAILLTPAVASCGSDTAETGNAVRSATAAAEGTPGNCKPGKYPASPTTDQLSGLLQRGLDPNVPAQEKVQLVQGAEGDPGFLDRIGGALRDSTFSAQITGVTDYCNGNANADAVLTLSGQSTPSQVPLVADNGVWKLDKAWTCGLARLLQQDSPICAA